MRLPAISSGHFQSITAFHHPLGWPPIRELAARWAHSPWLRIRPRVSLLSGSVLVLLTLYIPVAFNACGTNRTGAEFLRGQGIWPGMGSLVQTDFERALYALGLALAVFSLTVMAVTLRRPALLQRPWIQWPFLAAGLACLFALSDFVWFNLSAQAGDFLNSRLGLHAPEIEMAMVDLLAILAMALCLRSKFLRSQFWLVWLFGVETIICLLALVDYALRQYGRTPLVSADTALLMAASPGILFWVVPMMLWMLFGFSRSAERHRRWVSLRPRITWMFLLAGIVAAALILWPSAWAVWGIGPYLGGLSLIFLGYAELAHAPGISI
jgi:hypothetical protein